MTKTTYLKVKTENFKDGELKDILEEAGITPEEMETYTHFINIKGDKVKVYKKVLIKEFNKSILS